ncbi:MAG: hypothetical protein PHI19_07070, partial [Clostridia bacterium]|nr:hypothetical protein [Clostridia bacterium]
MKKKTNKMLFILLVLILAFSLLSLAACQPPTDTPEEEDPQPPVTTDTAIVKNGNFANASNSDDSNAYVKDSVTNWTPASGVTSYSTAKVGVIDLTESEYDANKSAVYQDMNYPGFAPNTPKKEDGSYQDTNALMISSTDTAGSLYYKSTAITIAKGKHYKLSFDVFTKILETDETELQGVWIYVNTGAYAEFQAINTAEEWKTYTLYIEANNEADRTMYIQLWLGYGPKFIGSSSSGTPNPRMTKGVALFDNIVMSKIPVEDYDAAFNTYAEDGREVTVVSDTKNEDTAIISLVYPDTNFSYVSDFSTTSSNSYGGYFSAKKGVPNTNNYTSQVGKDDIEDTSDFPSSSYSNAKSTVGIFDMSKLFAATYDEQDEFKEYADTYKAINSSFVAPKNGADYEFDAFMDPETREYRLAGRPDAPADSTALTIYHPDYAVSGYGYKSKNTLLIEKSKYYTISVWVYLWVPEFGKTEVTEPALPTEENATRLTEEDKPNRDDFDSDEAYNNALTAYNANVAAWKDYDDDKKKYDDYIAELNEYNAAKDRAQATFKLTGATIEGGETVRQSTEGQLGEWEQLTFNIRGNELSNRSVSLEFWYGEGNWGEDTLMAGGCFFDNVTITASKTVANPTDYETLSPLEAQDYTQFGLLDNATQDFTSFVRDDTDGDWEYSFEDDKTSDEAGDAGIISGSAAENEAIWKNGDNADFFADYTMPHTFDVKVDGNDKLFNLVMLRNNIYTSSILKYLPKDNEGEAEYLRANPNAFARLSMWVYTENIDDEMGLTAALVKSDDTQLTSLSKVNTQGEWTELVFYLQGSSDDAAEFYLKCTLGTGDNYTPASLIKGVVHVTAITYKSVAYSEYKGATTGTYTTKYTVPSSTTQTDSVTNGWFTKLDSTTYSGDDKDIFDENGNLIGIGIPESWTAKSAESSLDKPTNVKIDNGVLSWTKGS